MPVITTDGLRVNYTDEGTGVPIVFVPGLGETGQWFHFQSSGLSDHYRVISYDLRRARGRSSYTLELLADDLARLLTALHIPTAVIAGHSFGGLVALQFAASHPDRCPALVLMSTMPSPPSAPKAELIAAVVPGGQCAGGFFSKLLKRLFGPKPNPADQASDDDLDPLALLTRDSIDLDPASMAARLNVIQHTDLTGVLASISMPTLIIAGSLEPPFILSQSQMMDEAIPDSTLEVIENADHYSFCTRHDLFNAILAEYLSHAVARL